MNLKVIRFASIFLLSGCCSTGSTTSNDYNKSPNYIKYEPQNPTLENSENVQNVQKRENKKDEHIKKIINK